MMNTLTPTKTNNKATKRKFNFHATFGPKVMKRLVNSTIKLHEVNTVFVENSIQQKNYTMRWSRKALRVAWTAWTVWPMFVTLIPLFWWETTLHAVYISSAILNKLHFLKCSQRCHLGLNPCPSCTRCFQPLFWRMDKLLAGKRFVCLPKQKLQLMPKYISCAFVSQTYTKHNCCSLLCRVQPRSRVWRSCARETFLTPLRRVLRDFCFRFILV